jgi:tetratricopeptide (TPR) repeat protein
MSGERSIGGWGVLAGVGCLVLLGGLVRAEIAPALESGTAPNWVHLEQAAESPTASLLGELRGGLADYLWMKADLLVHNGVELRALTEAEKRDQRRWQATQAAGHDTPVVREEDEGTTVVPNREADHRGVLGDLERQIKPFMDMRSHTHRDPAETAALFRLMTWVNPHFTPAWLVGANVLCDNMGKKEEALAFLREGAEKNPDNLELQSEIGRYLLWTFHDDPGAERQFRRAIEIGARHRAMPEDELDAWETAHKWLVIQYKRLGRQKEAREVAETAIRRFPKSNGYFVNVLKRMDREAGRAS